MVIVHHVVLWENSASPDWPPMGFEHFHIDSMDLSYHWGRCATDVIDSQIHSAALAGLIGQCNANCVFTIWDNNINRHYV